MTPTQAQIDAAALRRWQDVVTQAMDCIRGETPEDVSFGEAEDDTFSKLREVDAEMSAALTAAAEVGLLDVTNEYLEAAIARRTKLNEVVMRDTEAATIERCAQVAERELSPEVGAEVAAAIRALATEAK